MELTRELRVSNANNKRLPIQMSDLSPQELLELKDTRRKIAMGIVWAAKRFGSDSKQVFIARAALKNLDEYIAEKGYDTALLPALVPFVHKLAGKTRKKEA